jgi:hypothetical protein
VVEELEVTSGTNAIHALKIYNLEETHLAKRAITDIR